MVWIYLFVAGVFETAWAIGPKYSAGFTKLRPSIFTIVAMMISIYLLAVALPNFARTHRLCSLDQYRHRRRGHPWNISFQ